MGGSGGVADVETPGGSGGNTSEEDAEPAGGNAGSAGPSSLMVEVGGSNKRPRVEECISPSAMSLQQLKAICKCKQGKAALLSLIGLCKASASAADAHMVEGVEKGAGDMMADQETKDRVMPAARLQLTAAKHIEAAISALNSLALV